MTLKKMFDSWYCSEVCKSFVQTSIVFEKVFPDKEPNKEYTKKIAGNILSYKVDCLEEIFFKNNRIKIIFYRLTYETLT